MQHRKALDKFDNPERPLIREVDDMNRIPGKEKERKAQRIRAKIENLYAQSQVWVLSGTGKHSRARSSSMTDPELESLQRSYFE